MNLSEQFNDHSNDWILYEHRLRRLKDKFPSLFRSTETTPMTNLQDFLLDLQSQIDRLDSLRKSLEPIDNHPTHLQTNRTKLHRFIRLDDDLEIINERLMHLHDHHLLALQRDDQNEFRRHFKLLFDRLHTLKRSVKIDLEQIETILVKQRLNSFA